MRSHQVKSLFIKYSVCYYPTCSRIATNLDKNKAPLCTHHNNIARLIEKRNNNIIKKYNEAHHINFNKPTC